MRLTKQEWRLISEALWAERDRQHEVVGDRTDDYSYDDKQAASRKAADLHVLASQIDTVLKDGDTPEAVAI